MSGFPELNTFYMVTFVLFNVILNFFLIPIFGITGAALATSGSFIFSAFLLILMTRYYLKIKL